MIKECPNHCYITDKNVFRCPRCGKQMLTHRRSKTQDEVIEETRQRQEAYRKDLK